MTLNSDFFSQGDPFESFGFFGGQSFFGNQQPNLRQQFNDTYQSSMNQVRIHTLYFH